MGNDKNALYALIQAMTYAVELSTKNQLKRLKDNVALFENLNLKKATVEIAIFLVNPQRDNTRNDVVKLVEQLNKNQKCEGLSRISIHENKEDKWSNLLDSKS
ncbi:MAG: hypothetical protein R3C03_22110 [Pirellulaceae bacterium]